MSDNVTKLWDMYEHGIAYQSNIGLRKKLPMFVKFFEGDQWAKETEATKNLPRPIINIIKMICRSKKAAIFSSREKLMYESDGGVDTEKLNRFAEYIQKEIGQSALDKKAVESGVKKGPYFFHYYWDAEARGKSGVVVGGVRCEIIDPLSIFFANPTECDEQKQKWILIASREEVSAVKEKCESKKQRDLVTADENDNNAYGTVEQEGDKLCTVLTRYFRKGGEVYFERATKCAVVTQPKPIAPDVKAAMTELGYDEEDAPNDSMPDKRAELKRGSAYLYPIVAGVYDTREKCIYGLGEIEGLINNQKAINFNVAMLLLNAQEYAWGKFIVHPQALRGQKITNVPGQMLIDHTQTMNGIKKMTEQAMPSQPLELANFLTQSTRSVTGATEVMTGEVLGKNMSGAAIAQLQAQASTPIDELRENFRDAKRKQGLILAQFFRLFYHDKRFTYTEEVPVTDLEGNLVYDDTGMPKLKKKRFFDVFNGADYEGAELEVVVETTSGTKSSTAGDINVLDTLFAKGSISLKTYIKAYPDDAISNKSEILKFIEEEESAVLAAQKAQLEESAAYTAQLEEQLAKSANLLEKQKSIVDNAVRAIQENSELKANFLALYNEAKNKILAANSQIEADTAKIEELNRDASAFALHIANGGGIPAE